MNNRIKFRDGLLLASLPHVAENGWVESAFMAGAVELGVEKVLIQRFFPGGLREFAIHFSDWADREMKKTLLQEDMETLKFRKRVSLAMRIRFQALAQYREAVRSSVSFSMMPQNAFIGISCMYTTVDKIWYSVGDESTDFSYYTKRAILAGLISAATLYWLNDRSDGFKDTWDFIDRRLENVMQIPKIRARLKKVITRLPFPFNNVQKKFRRSL